MFTIINSAKITIVKDAANDLGSLLGEEQNRQG